MKTSARCVKILDKKSSSILEELNNRHVLSIVEKYAELCKPAKVTVLTDSEDDTEYVRKLALENNEESNLALEGHTIHFDGYNDQGRDKLNTKILVPEGTVISKYINTGERESCLEEVHSLMSGIMKGKEMLVRFFCLGPKNSKFSISAMQITDSAYVAHSESILYRPGFEQFKTLNGSDKFFYFVHSAGELENNVTKNVDKRRIYVDMAGDRVFTINNQYAGNSMGLKKLALRLAIKKSHQEDWLCEHMFIMGAKRKGRTTYFTGAFPSGCGKTSTAMLPGQTIIGDDIAYIKLGDDRMAYAVNVEQGIFGIIEDINPKDDPMIYEVLTTPGEIIFSNVLVKDNLPYWLGMGKELPGSGENFSGRWYKGKTDAKGNTIPAAHKNARYTIRIKGLPNTDPRLDDPDGVPVSGMIYGGRDSDTSPPVLESLSWPHGVFIGSAIESETTATTLGKTGVRKHNPMANLDFLVIPFGRYIERHLKFGKSLETPPKIFATNYFLKDNGRWLNGMLDKKVWLMWMEGRIHGEFEAINTPVGRIPKYEDLKALFREHLDKEYSKEDYGQQFSIRTDKLLERLDRIEEIFKEEEDIPDEFTNELTSQRERLVKAKEKYKKAVISPFEIE
ncbi:phosphoenolpyruvate carboxykinase (GTP) [Candidatus Woesearchaeota archaeon]|nr:phosphoenolpyruvate carboxykinase (GTP) [Candidatus Woesearchaeota archaeon]